jgi:hypothetical protein
MIKLQKLLSIQKNKFNQLKNAYDEVEREKEHIKVLKSTLEFFMNNFSFAEYFTTTSRYINKTTFRIT